MIRIGLIGDLRPEVPAHVATPRSIELAAAALGMPVAIEWIATPHLAQDPEQKLAGYHGLWAVPNTPYDSMDGALNGIRFAREHAVPFLGTCGGYQHMLIEYARNVLGFADADHAESNPGASVLPVTPLACSLNGQSNRFTLDPRSKVAGIYGKTVIVEEYGICNYGLNPAFRALFEAAGMHAAGEDGNGEARIVELARHPFFIGTLFQPQRSAFQEIVHPLIKAFLAAAR